MESEATINELVRELKDKQIEISYSEGRLRYSGPEENIDDDIISKLKANKQKLIRYLWPDDCPNMMPINTEGNKIPLILLHAGEANYSLSEHLGKDQPFYGFFYIGSEGEKIRYKSIESFAGEYVKQLLGIIPEGPYIIGGFSMGGILGYEMAVQLRKKGHEVPGLILVDCEIPAFRTGEGSTKGLSSKHGLPYRMLRNTYDFVRYKGRHSFYSILSIFGLKVPARFRKLYILWTYSRLMNKYRPQSEYDYKMMVFRTEENDSPNKYLGWDRLSNDVELVSLKGDHSLMYADTGSVNTLKQKISGFVDLLNN